MATLLYLPGTLCDARVWAPIGDALAPHWHGIHVDYRDQRSITSMARCALEATSDELIPVGLSMGAIVALEIWRQAPQRVRAVALFGVNPGADIDVRRARRLTQVAAAHAGALEKVARGELAPAYVGDSAVNADIAELVTSMALAHGPAAFEAQSAALGARDDYWPMLASMRVPVLLACGEHDQICPPAQHRRMQAQMPLARCITIPGAGHLAPLQQAQAVSAVLRDWLQQLP
jgi:pimeloyl-ACP methyl ester carboxylesterase